MDVPSVDLSGQGITFGYQIMGRDVEYFVKVSRFTQLVTGRLIISTTLELGMYFVQCKMTQNIFFNVRVNIKI